MEDPYQRVPWARLNWIIMSWQVCEDLFENSVMESDRLLFAKVRSRSMLSKHRVHGITCGSSPQRSHCIGWTQEHNSLRHGFLGSPTKSPRHQYWSALVLECDSGRIV